MRNLTEHNATDAVVAQFEGARDPRLKQILTSLIRHVHDFVREVELTEAEWLAGIQFLTAIGHMCDDKRQEFILLSDTLGVSILVDAINHRKPAGATESSILGPFYVEGAPELPLGASIARNAEGDPVIVSGRVLTPQGRPISSALLDVWQAAPNGFYDVQKPQPGMDLRGKFQTDANGRYEFRTVKPASYPIPHDGPVGRMLEALGRHPYRPAHIHVMVSAPGYEPLTTMLFVEGDKYLDSDAVFAVKSSLVAEFIRHDSPEEVARLGLQAPFYSMTYDFGLKPAA